MLVLVGVGALVLALILVGEWTDYRFQRRREPVRLPWGAPAPGLPEPLIPSTIRRNASNG